MKLNSVVRDGGFSTSATEREKAAVKGTETDHAALDTALPQTMIGDAARMQDLLGHLLDNAIKFTHRGSVDLKLTREDEILKIEVRDTGIGIEPERQARDFRVIPSSRQRLVMKLPWTGLGLGISSKVACPNGWQDRGGKSAE